MNVAVLVLAAGAGARLGVRNKAALRDAVGRTFLHAVVATARAAGATDVVVVAGPPHGEETLALAAAAGARVAWNEAPERGMISSIVVGLDAIPHADAILVWPVDHAAVGPTAVRTIVTAASRGGIVVPVHGGRGGHPTAFGGDLFAELRGAATARDVVAADPRRVVRLPIEDAAILRDVDHPEDLP